MADQHAPEPEDDASDLGIDDSDSDSARHYLQDPNNLGDNARDEDEQEQDDVLDVDQTELEELGLTLDDPHQPDSE